MSANASDAQTEAARHAMDMWYRDKASQHMGMEIVSIRPGEAVVTMPVRADMINGHGTCHGSYIFALADSAFAFACNSHGPVCVAADCQISFLRPVLEGTIMSASATETYRRGRNGVYDITVTGKDDEIVALFRGKSRQVSDARANNGKAT